MRCEEFEARLNEVIDERGQPGADAALAAHASACPACEQLQRDMESMLAIVPMVATRVGAAPAGMPLRVVADWQASRRDDRTRRRSRVMLAMAASLLAALIPAGIWFAQYGPLQAPQAETAQPELIAQEMPKTATSAPETAVASHDGADTAASDTALPDAQPALVDQARETYKPLLAATSEQWASVWGADNTSAEAAPAQRADDEADANFELAGIRPVAESASRSVAALLRVLPGSARALGEQGIPQ